MTKRKDESASVKQRLLNLAKARGEEFNMLLVRYVLERLLFRLERSAFGSQFVVKGAMMFYVWSDAPHRPTRDLDLLSAGPPDLDRLAEVFRAVCATQVDDDGVAFAPATVKALRIRAEEEYKGVRITFTASLGRARVPVQVDVGFGDATVPLPELTTFPVLLGHAAPHLRAYRRETAIAEKFHAMVDLGMANSRMKDFFDLHYLANRFAFDGQLLGTAIRATFSRRSTPVPTSAPVALTAEFFADAGKLAQWKGFLNRSRLAGAELTLLAVATQVSAFVMPVAHAIAMGSEFTGRWEPGGPWQAPK